MQRWRERALDSVAAMYEDRYDLWGLAPGGRLLRRSVPARRARVRPPDLARARACARLHAGRWRSPMDTEEPHRCCAITRRRRAPVLAEGSVQASQPGTAAPACRRKLCKLQPGAAPGGLRPGGGAARAGAV
jgi:hypothetical protein